MYNTVESWNFHQCKLCSYRTRSLHYIRNHVRQHITKSQRHRFSCVLHSPEAYQCEKCQFQFYSKVLLTKHFDAFHKRKETQHYSIPVLRVCPRNCDFQTYSSLILLNHVNSCDRPPHTSQQKNESHVFWKCAHCPYQTTMMETLHEHILRKHSQPAELKCDQCPYKSAYREDLRKHTVLRHTPSEQVGWFTCDHCSYKTKRNGLLKKHIYQNHKSSEQIDWFKCKHCSYKTTTKNSLTLHTRRMHTPPEQITWFKCDYCPFYVSKTKHVIDKHVLKRHTKTAKSEKA